MPNYNLFDASIPENLKKQHESNKIQSEDLIEASNLMMRFLVYICTFLIKIVTFLKKYLTIIVYMVILYIYLIRR